MNRSSASVTFSSPEVGPEVDEMLEILPHLPVSLNSPPEVYIGLSDTSLQIGTGCAVEMFFSLGSCWIFQVIQGFWLGYTRIRLSTVIVPLQVLI